MKKYLAITTPIALLLVFFIYLPIGAILTEAFSGKSGFSGEQFGKVFADKKLMKTVQNSFVVAASSAAIATIFGTMLGYGLDRYRFPGKRLFNGVLHVPVFVPDIVLGVAMLLTLEILYFRVGLERGMASLILAHVTIQIPMVAIIVRARLEGWAASYEEAAADLGASPTNRFRTITIPMIRPGIIAGGLLAFTISLGDFVLSYFTAGTASRTVPLEVYRLIKDGRGDEVNALASILILTSLFCAVAVAMLQRSRKLETVEYGDV